MENVDFTPLLLKIKNDYNIVLPRAGKKAHRRKVTIKEETDKLLAKKLPSKTPITYGEIYNKNYGSVYAQIELRKAINSLSYGDQKLIDFALRGESLYIGELRKREEKKREYTKRFLDYAVSHKIVDRPITVPSLVNAESLSSFIVRYMSSETINEIIATLIVAQSSSVVSRWDANRESNLYADLVYVYGNLDRYYANRIDFRKIQKTVNTLKVSYLKLSVPPKTKPLQGKVEYHDITWDHVRFDDGYIFISDPFDSEAPLLRSSLPASKKSYEYIKSTFVKKMPPIRVAYSYGVMRRVEDKPMLGYCVMSINRLTTKATKQPRQTKAIKQEKKVMGSIASLGILGYIKQFNSKYLNYLCSIQKEGRVILHCKESQTNLSNNSSGEDEDAFIFTTYEGYPYSMLVYENANPSRSTYSFLVKSGAVKEAAKEIGKFFTSKNGNKREMLMQKRIEFDAAHIVAYYRTIHTDFFSWKCNLPRR